MDYVGMIVELNESKMRLEDFLSDRFRRISRMHLREVLRNEKCEVNGRVANAGLRLRPNDFVEIYIDLTREHSMLPQNIQLDVEYEDSDLIVVNKPPGMLVHPSHREKNGTVLNALTYYLNAKEGGGFVRPGLVHRLDKETSGLLLVAKNTRAHRILAQQFRLKTVEKKYLAIVEGAIKEDTGTIDAPIGRYEEKKSWNVKLDGKPAETRFRVVERRLRSTLVELEPVTGRTNQLRIHCAAIDHPIFGDVKRGGRAFPRLCLHASRLSFAHPVSRNRMEFTSELPAEFAS